MRGSNVVVQQARWIAGRRRSLPNPHQLSSTASRSLSLSARHTLPDAQSVTRALDTSPRDLYLHRSQSTLSPLRVRLYSTAFSLSTTNPAMASLTPPQPAPTWTHTADDVLRLTKEAIERDKTALDKVAALKPEECNFDSASSNHICVHTEI